MKVVKIKKGLYRLLLLCLAAVLLSSAALANSTGTVTADGLYMRSSASTSASIIDMLGHGTEVTVLETADGWHKVEAHGRTGYVCADYVKLDGSDASGTGTITGSGVNIRAGASTSSSVIACVSRGTSVTVTGRDGDWYQLDYKGQTAYVRSDYLSLSGDSGSTSSSSGSSSGKTGTISGTYVRFRAAASTSSNILLTFDKGASVTVTGSEGDWYKVDYSGKSGYVYKSYVSVEGESPSSSSSGKSGTISGTYVRFRAAASTSSGILLTFDKGASVTVTGSEGDWYKVDYSGKSGYVYKSYVSLEGESSSSSSSVTSASGTGIIRGTCVRVRAGASTSSSILATVNTGTKMEITGKTGEWYQVNYNGQTGYVYKSYLLTEEEYEQEISNAGKSSTKGEALVAEAKKYLGVPYVYGGTSPSGFDCSGLVYYVYKQLGYSIYRTATAQYGNGRYVERSSLQPGDIVIFYNSGMTSIGHAGMYIGNGQFIHASSGGGKVQINNLTDYYYNTHYYGARRVV